MPFGESLRELPIAVHPGRQVGVGAERKIGNEHREVPAKPGQALAVVARMHTQAREEDDWLSIAVDFNRYLKTVEPERLMPHCHPASYAGSAVGAISSRRCFAGLSVSGVARLGGVR